MVNNFPAKRPTPSNVLRLEHDILRTAGLSNAKAKYIKDLAQHVNNKKLHLQSLENMTDDEVKTELIQVKGIGNWTVEMFLIFTLARPNLFSLGDLGLRKDLGRP